MKIGLVTTHSFPIPTPTHTGDIVILDLAIALTALGHEVTMFAPEGTQFPNVLPMPCSRGASTPLPRDAERACFERHLVALHSLDIVHDFSTTKYIAEQLLREGRPAISTLLGCGPRPEPPRNIVVWSKAMRGRCLRGATDYENTPTPDLGGPSWPPIADAHVVPGGVDTGWYTPGDSKHSFFLWMNRWHPAKGYKLAIDVARASGIELVMAGEHPDYEMFAYQRDCALEAVAYAKGLSNVHFEFLPPDPDHHTDKRELYRKARALLYTVQFQEPFGLSQVEALACGTPVIGTRFGSVPEVIEGGVTGYVCSNTIEDVTEAIEMASWIDSRVCRSEAVRRFDRSVMAPRYVQEYEEVITGRGWG